jgi:hypothetical protein
MEPCIRLLNSPARINVSVKTIQKWDRLGILPANRTITNHRYYTDEELSAALRVERIPHLRRTVSLLPGIEPGAKTGLREPKKNTGAVLPAAGNRSG